ncbi:MAG: hypothetical protein N2506_04845, partial [Dehalococcoidales bacterium]|nr:hypothetical protein [Dehalococcoidales bacterium]
MERNTFGTSESRLAAFLPLKRREENRDNMISRKRKEKGLRANRHLRYIIGVMLLCSIIYYFP